MSDSMKDRVKLWVTTWSVKMIITTFAMHKDEINILITTSFFLKCLTNYCVTLGNLVSHHYIFRKAIS